MEGCCWLGVSDGCKVGKDEEGRIELLLLLIESDVAATMVERRLLELGLSTGGPAGTDRDRLWRDKLGEVEEEDGAVVL